MMGIINTLNFIVTHPLNERRKLKAVRRWFNWQIGSRLVPGPVAVEFVNNTMLLISSGMTGATGNVYAGLHEFQDMAFVLHFLRQGDVFVDVGANIGTYTVLAGGLGANCISIEPGKNSFDRLLLNINLNGIHNIVTAHNIAVGSRKGKLPFTENLDTVNHVAIDSEKSSVAMLTEIEVDTLDHVIADSRPVLVKIDVEGFETEVIAGAGEMLSRKSLLAVIMELNGSGQRYNYDEQKLYERMIDYGFSPYSYAPLTRSLEVLNEKNGRVGNILFVKDPRAVSERLKIAPPFTVLGKSV